MLDTKSRTEKLDAILVPLKMLIAGCRCCGHHCNADRTAGDIGCCSASSDPEHVKVSSFNLHYGEESVLVGHGGSGTVFFTHCNLHCVFCQNYDISQLGMGEELHYTDMANIFRKLQAMGAENINLVSPTHYIYPIALALRHAFRRGLTLPIVYNTGGYDSVELLRLLEGIVDIYMPDMKYMDGACAAKFSEAPDYPEVAKAGLKEMWRQVGPLEVKRGVARKGLLIRHLVIPNNVSGTSDFLAWLAGSVLSEATVNLMSQYTPQYRASQFSELSRRPSTEEYARLVNEARLLGLRHVLSQ